MKTIDQLILELNNLGIKLWVEEDTLRYRASKGAFTPEIKAELKEKKHEIIKFLKQLQELHQNTFPPIKKVPRTEDLPLSSSQKMLWLQHQLEPNNPILNMGYVFRLKGELNIEILEKSLNELLRRHEVLRSNFFNQNGQPKKVIKPELNLEIAIIDIQHIPPDQIEKEAQRLSNEELCRPFDLSNDPLVYLKLFRLAPDHHILIFNAHRIVCDGGSTGIFLKDLIDVYRAFSEGKPSPLPESNLNYEDYIHWYNDLSNNNLLDDTIKFWQKFFEQKLPFLDLPTDYPRTSKITYNADRCYFTLPVAFADQLIELSQNLGCTLFTILFTAYNILLYRYTQQPKLLVNFAHSGRKQEELERILGAFTKTLPIISSLSDELSFKDLLKELHQSFLEADHYYNVSFNELIEKSNPEEKRRRSPLLQTQFVLNPAWKGENNFCQIDLPKLTIYGFFGYVFVGQSKFDLVMLIRDSVIGLQCMLIYNTEFFKDNFAQTMINCYGNLLKNILLNPDQKISEIEILNEQQKQQLLIDWNQTDLELPKITNLAQQIEAKVKENPQKIAVIINQEKLTYQQLNEKANQLANYLQSLGVKSQTKVAIYLNQSCDLIITIFAILKVGGIVIPLETSDLSCRNNKLLKNSHISFLITVSNLKSDFANFSEIDLKIITLDQEKTLINQQKQDNLTNNLINEIGPQQIAWFNHIPTPEGESKAVKISHQNIIAQSYNLTHTLKLTEQDHILHLSTLNINNLIEAIFPALLTGATLNLKTIKSINSLEEFCQEIKQQKINILNLPTAFWYEIIKEISVFKKHLTSNLKLITIGGEQLSPIAVKTWFKEIGITPQLLNTYGTVETTMTALTYEIKLDFKADQIPLYMPIGRPIANNKVYILDHNQQPVPVGANGEIYLGGMGICQGYDQDEKLTQTKLIINPFNPQEKLYQTGDIGRYLEDGNIELRGRFDQQIKINGLRIEPAEIELQLQNYPQIKQAVVILHQEQSQILMKKYLVAYLVKKSDQNLDNQVILAELKQHFPDYLIPSQLIEIDAIPMLENGQVDRQFLETLTIETKRKETTFIEPKTELELKLAKIWKKVLKIDKLGIHDNFFDLGGQSVLAIQVVTQIQEKLKLDLPLSKMLETPTIAQLVNFIEQPNLNQKTSELPFPVHCQRIRQNGEIPLYFIHIEEAPLLYPFKEYLDQKYALYALSNLGEIVASVLTKKINSFEESGFTVETLASQYVEALLKVQPQPPYYLLGISFGGIVAYEMAQQLIAMGKKVDNLILLDTANPLTKIFNLTLHQKLSRNLQRLKKIGFSYFSEYFSWKISQLKYVLSKQSIGSKIFKYSDFMIHDILKYHGYLKHNYLPQKYQGQMTFIEAEEADFSHGPTWQNLANGKAQIVQIPGTHLGMYQEPFAQILVNKLEVILNQSEKID